MEIDNENAKVVCACAGSIIVDETMPFPQVRSFIDSHLDESDEIIITVNGISVLFVFTDRLEWEWEAIIFEDGTKLIDCEGMNK
jgi:hypothetical protein